MEALEDSNCHSMSDSFSLYERYMRSFNVVDSFLEDNNNPEASGQSCSSNNSDLEHTNSVGNIVLGLPKTDLIKPSDAFQTAFSSINGQNTSADGEKKKVLEEQTDYCTKPEFPRTLLEGACLMENSSVTEDSRLTEKSDPTDVPISSEDSKSDHSKHPKPVIITSLSTMENSNNAVDSVPLFRDVRPSDSIFKLPIRELSFNGTIKHVQKLKPIVDPIRALTSVPDLTSEVEKVDLAVAEPSMSDGSELSGFLIHKSDSTQKSSDLSDERSQVNRLEDLTESTGDSQYEEFMPGKEVPESDIRLNPDQSFSSSLDASFDSGVRSPDMFSDDELELNPEVDDFWNFLKDYEAHDKVKVRKMEETLQGVLPPPSVTILKTDVTDMLKKYYSHLPTFCEETNIGPPEANNTTPTKLSSFVTIPTDAQLPDALQETTRTEEVPDNKHNLETVALQSVEKNLLEPLVDKTRSSDSKECQSAKSDTEISVNVISENKVALEMTTEAIVTDRVWPDVLKCRFYDVHYNITRYSERMETLAMRCGERYVGAETDSTVTVYSGGLQSPSSASKRKAMRLKMAQAKSPGRRLSHLARRRQAFCSAATIGEKAHSSTAKMVLIDKKKLINSAERRSPRLRRTPGKRTPGRKTPGRKTPGKKTPAKTPKTRSGGSSHKKAMRRLLMDPEIMTRSQPTRETSKRALFISPENRKSIPQLPSTSVPVQAMKSKRALFGSPDREAETKSLDGTQSDMFLKRKRDALNETQDADSRCKIAKSLSFGGDSTEASQSGPSMARRASEVFAAKKNFADLDVHHRQKLLWAVSEALRIHGWRMQSPGFREKAASLARLTRRLLTLPPHAARLAAPKLSTSETMLKIARQYVYAIIQGRSVEDCFQDEQKRLANDGTQRVTGYVTASAYQQFKARQAAAANSFQASQIKENTCDGIKQDQPKSGSKNILQDKLLNVDSNSNSSSGLSLLDKTGLYKSNSMPSFEEAAKMRARRQISFDNVDLPKR